MMQFVLPRSMQYMYKKHLFSRMISNSVYEDPYTESGREVFVKANREAKKVSI